MLKPISFYDNANALNTYVHWNVFYLSYCKTAVTNAKRHLSFSVNTVRHAYCSHSGLLSIPKKMFLLCIINTFFISSFSSIACCNNVDFLMPSIIFTLYLVMCMLTLVFLLRQLYVDKKHTQCKSQHHKGILNVIYL